MFVRESAATELRAAWRGIRARRWRAGLIVGMLSVGIGTSAVVFSAADSFVFDRIPYPNIDRLMVLQRSSSSGTSAALPPEDIWTWRKHTDLFSAVHAHQRGPSLYLTTGDITESVRSQLVTPGLFESLGVGARWGRLLQPGDERPDRPPVALIGEELARRLFGDPSRAVGQLLQSGSERLHIVGVMPVAFRFPTSLERIWRPFDLATVESNYWLPALFQIAPGADVETVSRAVADRAPAVARAAQTPRPRRDLPLAVPLAAAGNARSHLVFFVLMGATVCVLLVACANVVSLELATAMSRARTYAIHAAVGASRSTLVRIGLLEGAVLIGASTAFAALLASWGTGALVRSLPPSMRDPLSNPVDLDRRALLFMAVVAAATWLLTSLPVAIGATRADLLDLLKRDERTLRLSGGAILRQALMVGQVALTVILLVGSLLTVRTYAARVGLEKGFDSTRLAGIQIAPPTRSAIAPAELRATILSRLRDHPGVQSVAGTDSLLPANQAGISNHLSIDGRSRTEERIKLTGYTVDAEYFATVGIRLLSGRIFTATDPPGYVVVDEVFARKYWPGGDALGARFHLGGASFGSSQVLEVIGITTPVRMESTQTPGGLDVYMVYNQIQGDYAPLSFVVRLEHERQLGALTSLIRSLAPGAIVRAELVETRYQRLYGDVRLAASVTSAFGALAFVVAIAGVYGVMMFLVTGRTREIGVRIALGAQPSDIRAIFVGAAARLVLAGSLLGMAGALILSRTLRSMLFGVTATDPATYIAVVLLVGATALAATWIPARHAARVNPVVALRTE